MANNFAQSTSLADTGNTKADLQNYVETMNPTSELTDTTTIEVSGNKLQTALAVPRWAKVTLTYSDFSKAAVKSDDITVLSLGAGAIIHAIKAVVTTNFEKAASAAFTTCQLDVGITAGLASPEFISNANMKTASTSTAAGQYYADSTDTDQWLTENGSTDLIAVLDCDAENTNLAVQGSVDIHVLYSISVSSL